MCAACGAAGLNCRPAHVLSVCAWPCVLRPPPPPLPICRLDQAAESKLSLLRMNAFAVDLL